MNLKKNENVLAVKYWNNEKMNSYQYKVKNKR